MTLAAIVALVALCSCHGHDQPSGDAAMDQPEDVPDMHGDTSSDSTSDTSPESPSDIAADTHTDTTEDTTIDTSNDEHPCSVSGMAAAGIPDHFDHLGPYC